MQNQQQIIQQFNSAPSKEAQSLTTPLTLLFHNHSADRLKELYDAGELSPSEVREEIFKAPKYYSETAEYDWILIAYRRMIAARPLASRPTAEQAHVLDDFANDLIKKKITPAEIDYAFEVRRLSPEQFAPHQGDVIAILEAAGFARPSAGRGERYVERLRALIDPEFSPKPRQTFIGARTAPEPPTEKLSPEERLAVIERVNNRIGKLGGELKPDTFGKGDAQKQRRADLFLGSVQHSIEVVEKQTTNGGPVFFAIIGRDKSGTSITPIRTEIKRADAEAFVQEARAL